MDHYQINCCTRYSPIISPVKNIVSLMSYKTKEQSFPFWPDRQVRLLISSVSTALNGVSQKLQGAITTQVIIHTVSPFTRWAMREKLSVLVTAPIDHSVVIGQHCLVMVPPSVQLVVPSALGQWGEWGYSAQEALANVSIRWKNEDD